MRPRTATSPSSRQSPPSAHRPTSPPPSWGSKPSTPPTIRPPPSSGGGRQDDEPPRRNDTLSHVDTSEGSTFPLPLVRRTRPSFATGGSAARCGAAAGTLLLSEQPIGDRGRGPDEHKTGESDGAGVGRSQPRTLARSPRRSPCRQ